MPRLPSTILLGLSLLGCAPAIHPNASDLPSPRDAARLPLSDFLPSATGPGLGAELVFSRGATLAGNALTLAAPTADGPSLAIVRWLGVTPGLVANVAFATPPAGVELATAASTASLWSFSSTAPALDEWDRDGTLLLAARNPTSAATTLDLAITFSIPSTLPAWEPAETFAVTALEEPSGIDYDFKRDRLWVVDDGGKLGRVNPDSGEVEATVSVDPLVPGQADLEAVRWVPGLDIVIATNELTDQLLLFAPDSLELLATASLVFTSGLTPVPTTGGDGLEGLAVTGVTGRTVHLVLANQNDPHGLYLADLTLPTPIAGSLTATVLSAHPQPRVNLSDVMLDWGSRRLFLVHGYTLPATLVSSSGNLSFALSDPSTEGATLRRGSLFTANDLGGLSARPQPAPP